MTTSLPIQSQPASQVPETWAKLPDPATRSISIVAKEFADDEPGINLLFIWCRIILGLLSPNKIKAFIGRDNPHAPRIGALYIRKAIHKFFLRTNEVHSEQFGGTLSAAQPKWHRVIPPKKRKKELRSMILQDEYKE